MVNPGKKRGGKRMKKFIAAAAVLVLFSGISFAAVTSGGQIYTPAYKTVKKANVTRLIAGTANYGRMMLINPTTSYVAYDIFYTTSTYGGTYFSSDTAVLARTRRFIKTLICAPILSLQTISSIEYDLGIQGAMDLSVVLSTMTGSGTFDGEMEHKIYFEYRQ